MLKKIISIVIIGGSTAFGSAHAACSYSDASSINIFDSRVFNWQYYLNRNADLLVHGIIDAEGAKNHWRYNGICEGRIAHPNFHTLQYLNKYVDLRNAFSTNYALALRHYLVNGIGEGRQGYDVGGTNGTYGNWTARSSTISVGTSRRVAGAIDSVFWNGKEFINSYDHGRQLQVAVSKNNLGECHNPTQAGSGPDDVGVTSSSLLQGIFVDGGRLATQVAPAFWRGASSAPCNATTRSAYTMNTDIQIGYAGYANAVRFVSQIYLPEAVNSFVSEAPTGYLVGDMTTAHYFNEPNGQLVPITTFAGEIDKPVVFSTPSGTHAFAIWSPMLPQFSSLGYEAARFIAGTPYPAGTEAQSTVKLGAVFRLGAQPAGRSIGYTSYVVVGSRETVRSTLVQMIAAWRGGRL